MEEEELDRMRFFKHVFTARRLEKTTQKKRSEPLAVALSWSWRPTRCESCLARGNGPCCYCMWRNRLGSPHFKSISGLSEGAGLKVITAPLFPLINYMNNI